MESFPDRPESRENSYVRPNLDASKVEPDLGDGAAIKTAQGLNTFSEESWNANDLGTDPAFPNSTLKVENCHTTSVDKDTFPNPMGIGCDGDDEYENWQRGNKYDPTCCSKIGTDKTDERKELSKGSDYQSLTSDCELYENVKGMHTLGRKAARQQSS